MCVAEQPLTVTVTVGALTHSDRVKDVGFLHQLVTEVGRADFLACGQIYAVGFLNRGDVGLQLGVYSARGAGGDQRGRGVAGDRLSDPWASRGGDRSWWRDGMIPVRGGVSAGRLS